MKETLENKKGIKKLLAILAVISFLAVLVSFYLIYQHYAPEGSEWCNFSKSFSCDIVNKSPYSTIDGLFNWMFPGLYLDIPIPNAVLSFLLFIYIFIGSILLIKGTISAHLSLRFIRSAKVLIILGLIYALWLVYIEAFVLMSWCILCITLDVLIIASLITIIYIGKIIYRG